MRAVTCPQCGGLIKYVLPRQPLAECDYCGAKIVIEEQFYQPGPFDAELAKFRAPERAVIPKTPPQPIFIAISGIGIFIFLLFVIAFCIR